MRNFFLGLDGGGTKTSASLIDSHRKEIAVFKSGGINFLGSDPCLARKSLKKILTSTVECIGFDGVLEGISISTAGISHEAVRREIEHIVTESGVNSKIIFSGDHLVALYSVFPSGYGSVLMAGTGSVGYARMSCAGSIKEFRVGGWGYLLGDECGGFDIGRRMLQRVCHSIDMDIMSSMRRILRQRYDIATREDLINFAYGENSKNNISSLAPLLDELYQDGDSEAVFLVDEVARDVVCIADMLIARIDRNVDQLGICGSILLNSEPIKSKTTSLIKEKYSSIQILEPMREPSYSSALIALDACK